MGLSVWNRSLFDIEADIKERSRYRNFVHLLKAAKLLIANEAWGATNSSIFPFKRPKSLAVKLLLELCTKSPISRRLTKTESADFRICAFFEGHTVLTNSLKLRPLRYGLSYSSSMLAEYHARETSVQAHNVPWVATRRGMYEIICEMISDGRRISRPELEGIIAGGEAEIHAEA